MVFVYGGRSSVKINSESVDNLLVVITFLPVTKAS